LKNSPVKNRGAEKSADFQQPVNSTLLSLRHCDGPTLFPRLFLFAVFVNENVVNIYSPAPDRHMAGRGGRAFAGDGLGA
jgi:hypothetical protein